LRHARTVSWFEVEVLSWIIVFVAALAWGIAGLWFVITGRQRQKYIENMTANKEADAVAWSEESALDVMERYPRSPGPAVVCAHLARDRRDWETALHYYRLAIARGRNDDRGYAGAAFVLRELKRFDESDALLRKGLRRLPRSTSLRREYAWNAHARGDWAEAARRWAAYRASDPADKVGYKAGEEALRKDGRTEEANALAAEAAARFSSDFEPARGGFHSGR
jgi:tetratricopeptide (TPR) repeat protein